MLCDGCIESVSIRGVCSMMIFSAVSLCHKEHAHVGFLSLAEASRQTDASHYAVCTPILRYIIGPNGVGHLDILPLSSQHVPSPSGNMLRSGPALVGFSRAPRAVLPFRAATWCCLGAQGASRTPGPAVRPSRPLPRWCCGPATRRCAGRCRAGATRWSPPPAAPPLSCSPPTSGGTSWQPGRG